MKRILFATNFSDSCDNAFAYLKQLVNNEKVKVDIVHVYDIPVSSMSTLPYRAIEGMLAEKKNASFRRMSDMMHQLDKQNQGKVYPVYGVYPSVYIADVAEVSKSDLIMMGMRGTYSMFERILGNTTAHTINQSDIPVLAIPSGANYVPINDILFPTDIDEINSIHEEEKEALVWLFNFWELLKAPKIHMLHVRIGDKQEPRLSRENDISNTRSHP